MAGAIAHGGIGWVAAMVMKPQFRCARRLDQVQMAWGLVYRRYTEKGLIDDNPFAVHTTPQAVGPHVCVIYTTVGDTVVSTLTAMADHAGKLPLDSVYADSLNDLRRQGRVLVEVGLLADRRDTIRRTARTLFDMMRWTAYYTLYNACTDIVIGVHPRHAGFYTRCFGFETFAEPTAYPMVKDNPVVPLWLPLRDALARPSLPSGLNYVRDNPVPPEEFSQRFMFEPEALRGSLIERFLESR